jgi:3D (Asp-Asp-Asp) domain-containing protein
MDLMSALFNKTVGIACITMLLQLPVKAQNQATSQTQSPKSSTSSSSTPSSSSVTGNDSLSNQLALVLDGTAEKAPDKATSKVMSEVRREKGTAAGVVEPKYFVKNPSLHFKVNPSESKLNERPFAGPSLDTLVAVSSFQATAYALRGRTRSGAYVRRGVIAADPRVIPLGSVVQISTPGYCGVYSVQDTGKLIKGKIVDLWVESPREARIFGRRRVKLHVLRLGPKPSSDK